MNTVRINVNYLAGPALNWAVAIALGWKWKKEDEKIILARPPKNIRMGKAFDTLGLNYFQPTNSWSTAGPIIERELITLIPYVNKQGEYDNEWEAEDFDERYPMCGPTPLIAAMRCYVASKLGEIVEVPRELYKEEA